MAKAKQKKAKAKQKKDKRVNFYHIEGKEATIQKIDDKLEETFLYLQKNQSKNIDTVELDDNSYYICAMDKAYVDENDSQKFAWLISISRLDTTSPIEIGDLEKEIEKRNSQLPVKVSQGRVIDTQFLYDPNTHVCAFARTSGGLNRALFKSFLISFCSVPDITFAVILKRDALKKLDELHSWKSFEYKIAEVDNFSGNKDINRDELKDIEYASDIGAKVMTMRIVAEKKSSGSVKKLIEKAKILFSNSESLGIEKLNIDGTNNDGVSEPIDLIQHKLVYKGKIEYDNLITEKNMFDYLQLAYHQNYDYFTQLKSDHNN